MITSLHINVQQQEREMLVMSHLYLHHTRLHEKHSNIIGKQDIRNPPLAPLCVRRNLMLSVKPDCWWER